MDTLRRPNVSRPTIRLRELVANALLIVGFVQMVLGIYEIGGFFNLGVGFAVLWMGALATFADAARRVRDEEEAFFRLTSGM